MANKLCIPYIAMLRDLVIIRSGRERGRRQNCV